MKYYLTGQQAGLIDRYTQDKVGIPGLVLMEKAAETAADELERKIEEDGFGFSKEKDKILIVSESGNNGGDGVAVARILKTHGYDTYVYEINGISSKSESYLKQVEIAKNLGVNFISPDFKNEDVFTDYRIIVDSVFGVGLTREVKGIQSEVIDLINRAGEKSAFIFSIDIPSGISSSNGHILGNAVKSDMTVTFQYVKYGMLVNEGREYSGEIICRDIGLCMPDGSEELKKIYYEYDIDDIKKILPARKKDSNKGTYGKVLVIAGSKDVFGAMYMAAESALRAGAGLVKVITDIRNRDVIADKLPEAVMYTYDSDNLTHEDFSKLEESVSWADVILVGPGIGTDEVAEDIFRKTIEAAGAKDSKRQDKKLVLDADALNIISQNRDEWFEKITDAVGKGNVVITPHMAEMSRISGMSIGDIKENPGEIAKQLSDKFGLITVLKDARTCITAPDDESIYINTTGNSGMSTGGSGDVLAGVISGLAAQMKGRSESLKDIASVAVNLHGRAGDAAAAEKGERGMIASDILVAICRDIC